MNTHRNPRSLAPDIALCVLGLAAFVIVVTAYIVSLHALNNADWTTDPHRVPTLGEPGPVAPPAAMAGRTWAI